ncbi:MAG: DUF4145 domain-containing protein [Oceanococcus sp.]|nr:MAG: DUF4145 domain-containing protein [Oceanococcus sp.]
MIEVLKRRFSELATQLDELGATRQIKHSEYSGQYQEVSPELLLNWCVKARSLIASSCGKDSEHFAAFVEAQKPGIHEDNVKIYGRVRAVFEAAREDFEGGYLVAVRNLVHAELAGSELDQARELFASGYVSAAAVVAGVVLETTLRTLCDKHSITHGKLDKMNADLSKAGQYNSLVQKRVTAMAAIRNSAAHGKGDEFSKTDVESMISDVERFTMDALS